MNQAHSLTAPPPASGGSLLEGLDQAAIGASRRSGPRPPRRRWTERIALWIESRVRAVWADRVKRRVAVALLSVLALAGAGIGVWSLLPRPIPDYAADPMDEIMDFTLLGEDFNALPVEKRLSLLSDLIKRIKTMSGEDSAMLAAFAASIRDSMRKQLEKNVKRLAVDVMDSYARDYEKVPPEEAEDFLAQKAIEFTRMMEDITGEKSGLPEDPDERLDVMKKQAKKDEAFMRENAPKQMDAARVARTVDFLQRDAAEVASPAQRSRVAKLGRDMTRMLRGQDVSTGKPKK